MTIELMEKMAQAAADSYMNNLDEQDKKYLLQNKNMYVKEYLSIYNLAMEEMTRKEQIKFQEFGESESKKMY